MAPRPNVAEKCIEQILDAAMVVFAQASFQEASMDEIAREAGLSKGAIYLYFNSKDALIGSILDRLFSVELDALKELQTAPGSVSDRLMALDRQVADDMIRMTPVFPILYEFYAEAARKESVRQVLKGYYDAYHERLVELLRQGVESAEFRAVNVHDVASAILAIYEGLALLWTVDPEKTTWGETNQTAIRLLVNGLRTESN
ncbi:MAG TPA: hypothetical protein DCP37_16185 [Dehalococcoidia bacterium]|jgi:AcrR family transcriptional regulator|nr:TetR/AcrR family transcriptional regulator [SAR202 cluster bacterium]HAL49289.1 hypothetical protein [Dehalococcoidia bacterium]